MNNDFDYIASQHDFADYCTQLLDTPWLAMDTEFMRERTYYAELSLIQIASPAGNALIDPLALADLAPLAAVMHNTSIIKIFHSPDQDIEVLGQALGTYPKPLFDTQLAAAFLGLAEQIGYAGLVKQLCEVELEKGETRTNWHQRPLTDAQLQYAALDVTYLHAMYHQLAPQLEARGRLDWVFAEAEALIGKQQTMEDPNNAWQRLKGGARLSPSGQQVAKRLAVWRERRAQQRNLPREWVLKTKTLLDLARLQPTKLHTLQGVDGISQKSLPHIGKELLAEIATAQEQAQVQAQGEIIWQDHGTMPPAERKQVKALMQHAAAVAERESMSAPLLLNRRAAETIIRSTQPFSVLKGWRAAMLQAGMKDLLLADQTP